MGDEVIDQETRDKVRDIKHDLANHVMTTQYKLDAVDKKIDATHAETDAKVLTVATAVSELKSILKWAGSLIVTLFIGALSWSLAQQYNANESAKKDLTAQVELLREQKENHVTASIERREILSRLPASAAEAGDTPNGAR